MQVRACSMRLPVRLLPALLLPLAGPPVAAAPLGTVDLYASGEQALTLCRERTDWCVGFVTGALDGWTALEAYYDGDRFCVPEGMNTGEITALFREELEEKGAALDEPAAYLLYERLIADFPCR